MSSSSFARAWETWLPVCGSRNSDILAKVGLDGDPFIHDIHFKFLPLTTQLGYALQLSCTNSRQVMLKAPTRHSGKEGRLSRA